MGAYLRSPELSLTPMIKVPQQTREYHKAITQHPKTRTTW